jgi:hypothetical protein
VARHSSIYALTKLVTSTIPTAKAIIWTNSSEAAAEINRPTVLFKEIEVMATEIGWKCGTVNALHRSSKDFHRRFARSLVTLCFAMLGEVLSVPSFAQSSVPQPPMDLGQTSFLDGEGGVGTLLEIIGAGYGASHLKEGHGRNLAGDFSQTSGSSIVHIAHTTTWKFLNANMGGEFLLPLSYVSVNLGGRGETTRGVGDLTTGAFLQWSSLRLFERPLSVRVDLDISAPTGSYQRDRTVNLGQNSWQISPYIAFTWRAAGRWEISGRLIYDWSSQNNQPPTPAVFEQAGDQLSFNLSASYAFGRQWRLGIASYTYQQLHASRIETSSIGGTQRTVGIGPGVLWKEGRFSVIGNVYAEFATKNRAEGYEGILRLLVGL